MIFRLVHNRLRGRKPVQLIRAGVTHQVPFDEDPRRMIQAISQFPFVTGIDEEKLQFSTLKPIEVRSAGALVRV